jgi:alpha-tubulin suppressor-like RCC1 family protein
MGQQGNGRLGNGQLGTAVISTPIQAKTGASTFLQDVVEVAGGDAFSMARLRLGTVYTYGSNSNGQLGNGNTTDTAYAGILYSAAGAPIPTAAAIAAGNSHNIVLHNYGLASTQGNKLYGRLGHSGTTAGNVILPSNVIFKSDAGGGYLNPITKIAAGDECSSSDVFVSNF